MDPYRLAALLILFVLPLTVLVTVAVVLVALTGRIIRAVAARRWTDLLVPRVFAQVSALALGAGVLVYYIGWFQMPWFDIDDFCAAGNAYTTTAQPFRLSATCTDGISTVQYVSGWVNPATIALTVLAAGAAVAAFVLRRRRAPMIIKS
ncbi:hypothetical protein [Jiangella gansuensis]|uniref:hypothetical protein n=1 Tax=Jiangella gansuensis TaxID=281473 RepID=UPI000478FEBF|nr:hypothetical protein [Jiangella gansuensis]